MTVARAAHLILYVADQRESARFWSAALDLSPSLDVPGMTEFTLRDGTILGLMPEAGIAALLPTMPNPRSPAAPRAELYLLVDDPAGCHERALRAGATELSSLERRSWGHEAAYSLDPDRHVLAFARECT
jgi:hypothetical protein